MSEKELLKYCKEQRVKLCKLERSLIKHEGFRPRFHFVKGILHFGVGHNCEANPLSEAEYETVRMASVAARTRLALELLQKGIIKATVQVKALFGVEIFCKFTSNQKDALTEMVFQMGIGSFSEFKETIKLIEKEDWLGAALEACDSKWYTEHKRRAKKVLRGFCE